MAPLKTTKGPNVTFLAWTPGNQPEEERAQQRFSRHQHTALATHQKRKNERDAASSGEAQPATPAGRPARQVKALQGAGRLSLRTKNALPLKSSDKKKKKKKQLQREDPTLPISISAEKPDPFNAYCISGISAPAQSMLQFALTHQWPAYATSADNVVVDNWKSTTIKMAINSPHLLQAIIYAGSCYRSFLGPAGSMIDRVRTESYHETLTLLRSSIQSLEGPPPDELLLAIAILAINGEPDYSNRRALTTLEHYRDNEFYFSKPWVPEHFRALIELTKLKGGPQNVAIPSIAAMIFITDLIESFSTLRKPSFPIFPPPDQILRHLRVDEPRGDSADGFIFLRRKRNGRSILRLIKTARDLLYSYSICLQGPGGDVELGNLVLARRVLQHQALSLDTTSDPLYMLCRLAVSIYLIESVVLMPALLPFHECASRKLMLIIDECDRRGCWQTSPNVMLWATVLGGLTARGRPFVWWFAEQLRGSAIPPAKSNWPEVLQISGFFLPFLGPQGEGCRIFWDEACDWLDNAGTRPDRVDFSTLSLRQPPRDSDPGWMKNSPESQNSDSKDNAKGDQGSPPST
ncbi:hypothetical protein PV08_03324 [Exophiala spinifera]|uniref:Uncharacterized protein n=1 Tax=Exophiala spinifera TaxID=91928 RepID=A0A0D2C683_9EURO|nr:uncharacterized protein PV08_03324 [Exophiala spinifera]KIW19034.1 hypothetical protein PV08_03324 [Exophiala spinifera]